MSLCALCSGLTALLNAKLPVALIHVRQINVSYLSVDCNVRHSSVTIACIHGTVVLFGCCNICVLTQNVILNG